MPFKKQPLNVKAVIIKKIIILYFITFMCRGILFSRKNKKKVTSYTECEANTFIERHKVTLSD